MFLAFPWPWFPSKNIWLSVCARVYTLVDGSFKVHAFVRKIGTCAKNVKLIKLPYLFFSFGGVRGGGGVGNPDLALMILYNIVTALLVL